MHMLTDRQVVDLVLGGDMHAFGRLVEMTEGLVAQIVYKLIPSEEDRKDVAQDVYLKVYRHLKSFKFQSKLSTWVGQIASTPVLTGCKRNSRPSMNPPKLQADDVSDRKLLQKELNGLLAAGIGGLPPVYQTLIVLYHQEELSYLEIRRITGLPGRNSQELSVPGEKTTKGFNVVEL